MCVSWWFGNRRRIYETDVMGHGCAPLVVFGSADQATRSRRAPGIYITIAGQNSRNAAKFLTRKSIPEHRDAAERLWNEGRAENSCRRLGHVRCARKSAHRPTPLRGSDRALLVWMTCAVSAGRQAKPVEQTIYSPTEFRSPRFAVPSLSFRRDGGVPGVRNCEDSRIPPTAFCCFRGSERTEIAVPSSSASGSSHSYLIAADVPGGSGRGSTSTTPFAMRAR